MIQKIIVIVSAAFLVAACSKKKDDPNKNSDKPNTTAPKANSPESGMALYEDIRKKLAADDLTGLADLTDRLRKVATVLKTSADKKERAHWGSLAKATERFGGVKDLKAARAAFGHLSRHVAALVAQGKPYANGLGVFQCPMVEDGFPYWVQKKGTVNNPYMGKQMLVCGGEVEPQEALSFKPKGSPEALLAAEMKAYEAAKPVFNEHCDSCHTTPSGKIDKDTKKALKHFVMDKYPFGGHHAHEIGESIAKALGARGKKAKMPKDDEGAVQGKELVLVLAWVKAFNAAHAAKAGHHSGAHDRHDSHKSMDMKKGDHKGMDMKKPGGHSDHSGHKH